MAAASPIWIALSALVGVTLSMPIVLGILKRVNGYDVPNARSMHVSPTPRGAGVALFVGVVAGFLEIGDVPVFIWLATAGFMMIGLADDLRSLSVKTRVLFQIALAIPVTLLVSADAHRSLLIALFGAMLMVATVNAVNFMDGINGITGLHAAIWGTVYIAALESLGQPSFSMVAVVLAVIGLSFLPWNWVKARAFLGDSGSYLIGALVSTLALVGVTLGAPLAFLGPLAIYALDTGTTLAYRIRAQEGITRPHRGHTYQRLVLQGMTHVSSALLTAAFTVAVSVLSLLSLNRSVLIQFALLIAIVCCGVVYLLTPVVVRRIRRITPREE